MEKLNKQLQFDQQHHNNNDNDYTNYSYHSFKSSKFIYNFFNNKISQAKSRLSQQESHQLTSLFNIFLNILKIQEKIITQLPQIQLCIQQILQTIQNKELIFKISKQFSIIREIKNYFSLWVFRIQDRLGISVKKLSLKYYQQIIDDVIKTKNYSIYECKQRNNQFQSQLQQQKQSSSQQFPSTHKINEPCQPSRISSYKNQIKYYQFILIISYQYFLNINKLKTTLQHFDHTIKCQSISNSFFIQGRLMIKLMLCNYKQFNEMFKEKVLQSVKWNSSISMRIHYNDINMRIHDNDINRKTHNYNNQINSNDHINHTATNSILYHTLSNFRYFIYTYQLFIYFYKTYQNSFLSQYHNNLSPKSKTNSNSMSIYSFKILSNRKFTNIIIILKIHCFIQYRLC